MANKLTLGKFTFVDPDLLAGSLYREKALNAAALGADTVQFSVVSSDTSITDFKSNATMTWSQDDEVKGIFCVKSIERTGSNRYTISGISPMGRLINMPHPGGIYTGQTVEEVVSDICGPVPVIIKGELRDIRLYGWLPYCKPSTSSARDNLVQVLFAIGAYLGTDLNGVLRVEPLWSGVSSTVPASRIYSGASVDYDSAVTAVSVTEHRYAKGTEETSLFEGTAQDGTVVTFDGPMSDLKATGFEILESGVNYAKLSAGAGTLTGTAYIHTTREVSETVSDDGTENVKNVTDATLVSMVNSVAVAKRLAAFYKRTETINAGIVVDAEKPGYIVSIYHPYDKKMVDACIQSMDFTVSRTTKAQTKALVGFVPPEPGADYYDHVEFLTEDTEITVPDGVGDITAVLVGGGQGGWSGLDGEAAADPSIAEVSFDDTNNNGEEYTGHSFLSAVSLGGNGGTPGEGGEPGKVLTIHLKVTPGTKLVCKIGTGGAGGKRTEGKSVAGSAGSATTITDNASGITYSSANGTIPTNGFLEETSNETYASYGKSGISGGAGGGIKAAPFTDDGHFLIGTASVVGPKSVPGYNGGNSNFADHAWPYTGQPSGYGWTGIEAYGGMGGGAAYGSKGNNGAAANTASASGSRASSVITCALGGAGADATSSPDSTVHGGGGAGGNGGGGAGANGIGFARNETYDGQTERRISFNLVKAAGGKGSDGSKGGDGIIALYYSTPKDTTLKALVTSDGEYLLDKYGRILVV